MNHYPHHIGDYLKDAAHLSLLQHGCYRRMLDVYYTREKPLPADDGAVCRLIGAVSKDERKAVLTVLNEFFSMGDRGWHNKRCDEEIALYYQRKKKIAEFWGQVPREVRTAMEARRRAAKLHATPGWLTDDDWALIGQLYAQARELSETTGIPHEVDHIVPLMGKTVRGLHVPWNLRVIPAYKNRAKGNAH